MKNVLFVTYYWPPAGGAVVNRMFRFYKYLPLFGWNPIILTIGNGVFPFVDESLEKEIREDTMVFPTRKSTTQVKSRFNPYGFTDNNDQTIKTKLIRYLKFNSIPDNRIYWFPEAVKVGKKAILENHIDLIFSTSPAHTNHLIASKLKREAEIPWVCDIRDPWTDVFWLKSNNVRFKPLHLFDKWLEKRTLSNANHITTVTPSLVQLFKNKGFQQISLIYNGYEPEYYTDNLYAEKSDQYIITYAGSMSYNHRPEGLFYNLNLIRKQNKILFNKIRVQFIGTFPPFLNKMISDYRLEQTVAILPFMPMREIAETLQRSDINVVNGLHGINHGAIPSKLFEAIGAGNPILTYGLDDDAQEVLIKSGCGQNFDFFDKEGISSDYIANILLKKINQKDCTAKEFSRESQTKQLAQIFDDVWSRRHH